MQQHLQTLKPDLDFVNIDDAHMKRYTAKNVTVLSCSPEFLLPQLCYLKE